MLPVILGAAARLLGGTLARGAATRIGASAAGEAMAGRAGEFVGGAVANSAAKHADRNAEQDDYPQDDRRR